MTTNQVSPSSSAPKGSATAISSSPSTSEKEKGSLLMIDPVTALGLNEPVRYDPAELRQTKVYQSTKRLLLWQRDNYLVGTDYADWRQQERSQNVPHHQPPGSAPPPRQSKSGRAAVQTRATTTKTRSTIEDWMANIPYEPYSESSRAMRPLPPSYGHLLSLSVPFIPSLTVRNALLPLLVGLPQHPPIFHWTEEMLANIILSQQTNLDRLVHNVLLNYLTNPNNRRAIKHSTQGYIVRTSVPDQNSNDGQ